MLAIRLLRGLGATFCAGRDLLATLRNLNFGNCCSEDLLYRFLSYCAIVSYQDARASGDTALSSPCLDLLATMRRVVNYHSSWARQRQVELFVASGNPGFTVVVVLTQLVAPQEMVRVSH
ncbi:ATP-dependent caseinolytic (Clp) protease/crotonase family protein [Dorcoceras hygrometricum]|uniref:ATP-dependent caseinolytic (Clp) protease/crotonase family protein n=1 Tax=Dorcoceras hygrometricum TaxID=472368 RepID=A0A2Z7A8B3_9LAMI|nr:ATP-dependent caseinolytic (Clp) protease/crotonase family protein [Dorcoceras hygrometricum]